MSQKTFGQALNEALTIALEIDETVFIAGEGVGVSIHQDPNMATHGLLEKFGSRRVKAGVGFGAGSQHSHNLESWIAHSPGLKIVWPSTPQDAKGLLLSAIFDPDPVIVVEDMMLYRMPGEVPAGDIRTPLGKARMVRQGTDCTIVAYGAALYTVMKALTPLNEQGISCEVIDLRSLVPLDKACILDSVRRTGRLVVVHEACRFCGFGAEIAAMVAEEAFDSLKGPVKRVGAPQSPVPTAPTHEKIYKPDPENVVLAVREAMGK